MYSQSQQAEAAASEEMGPEEAFSEAQSEEEALPQKKAFPEILMDPQTPAPQALKDEFKRYIGSGKPGDHPEITDSRRLGDMDSGWKSVAREVDELFHAFKVFQDSSERHQIEVVPLGGKVLEEAGYEATYYESPIISGLYVIPSFLPPNIQWAVLSRLFLRDLSNPVHKTNLHAHYDIQYPPDGKTFFNFQPETFAFKPKDEDLHKPLTLIQAFKRKLRWMTLGGQYDWTKKTYPKERPPRFPKDIAQLLCDFFCRIKAQAAIVNLYSPGDTLALHRDVSEEVNQGLVSISFGCDALFFIGTSASRFHVLRLHSGDAVFMRGEGRYAWHGVPKVIKGTCPTYLEDFPGSHLELWKDVKMMANKRVNLNVRQMFMDDIEATSQEESNELEESHDGFQSEDRDESDDQEESDGQESDSREEKQHQVKDADQVRGGISTVEQLNSRPSTGAQ